MVKKTKEQAFTIVELVIVIAVIAILAAIIIPTYSNLVKKANEATALVDAKNMITEMLADILSGDKDAADILVFSKKGNDVFLYGYDASRGVVLPYKVSPLKDFGKNPTVTDGHEFYKQAASFCKTIDGTDINIVTVNIDDWRKPEVLNLGINGEKSTVEELGFDKNTMAVFANYDIVPESFAKKNSGGETCEHNWVETSRTDATCTTAGEIISTCSKCNETKTEAIAALGHDWLNKDNGHNGWASASDTEHKRTCSRDASHVETGTHDTEGTDGACSVCGYKAVTDPCADGHQLPLTKIEAVASTCKDGGNNEYYKCERCGKYFKDANATTPTTPSAEGLAKTDNHSFGEWNVTKEPTCVAEGKRTRTCSVCNKTEIETLPIDETKHSFGYIKVDSITHKKSCSKYSCSLYNNWVTENHTFDANGKCVCGEERAEFDLSTLTISIEDVEEDGKLVRKLVLKDKNGLLDTDKYTYSLKESFTVGIRCTQSSHKNYSNTLNSYSVEFDQNMENGYFNYYKCAINMMNTGVTADGLIDLANTDGNTELTARAQTLLTKYRKYENGSWFDYYYHDLYMKSGYHLSGPKHSDYCEAAAGTENFDGLECVFDDTTIYHTLTVKDAATGEIVKTMKYYSNKSTDLKLSSN